MSHFKFRRQISLIVLFTFCFSILCSGMVMPRSASAYHVSGDHGSVVPSTPNAGNGNPNNNDSNPPHGGDDPVDLTNGNFYHEHQDLLIPGRMPLEVIRKYNHQDMREGPFGYGWTFNYDISLTMAVKEGVTVWTAMGLVPGMRLEFRRDPSGSIIPPKGFYFELILEADGISIRQKDGKVFKFDASGKLVKIVDRNNNGLTFSYDGSGRLITVSDDTGRSLRFSYGTNNKISRIVDPANREFLYQYDSQNNLTGYVNPAGYRISYGYDARHRLVSITDPKGTTFLTNTYDSSDRVSQQVVNGGTYLFEYHPNEKYTRVCNPRGGWTTYYFNENGRVIKEIDPLGNTVLKTWDDNDKLTSLTDARGNTTYYEYNSNGNLLKTTDPAGNITTFKYDPNFEKLESITDPLGRTVHFEYDDRGNLTKYVDELGNATVFTYGPNGDLLTKTDALGNITTFSYDSHGMVTQRTDALGYSIRFTYDSRGNLTSVTDQLDRVTRYEYDSLDQVIKIVDALGNIIQFTYDENNHNNSITDAQGNTTQFVYDIYGRLTRIVDALGNYISFSYDANGNKISQTDPEGNQTEYVYDELDRLKGITTALGDKIEYEYDSNGNMVSIKDANNNVVAYSYDILDRLVRISFPDGSVENFSYDKVGNLISKTDQRGYTIHYLYDNLDRLTSKIYPDASRTTYGYDRLNRLVSAVNSSSNIQYTYDALGRLIAEIDNGKNVSYEYDEFGNITKITYPDGTYIRYVYDSLNRIAEIRDTDDHVVSSYNYDSLGRKILTEYANGDKVEYQYDPVFRLTSIINKDSSNVVISRFDYVYGKSVLNCISMDSQDGMHNYVYDKLFRLKSVDYPDGYPFSDIQFNYDSTGNRTSSVSGEVVSYVVNNMNEYTQVNGTAFSYDASGNLIFDGVNRYEYDFENRLVKVTTPDDTITFTYDAIGRRIAKTDSHGSTRFIYSNDRVIAETSDTGSITAKYVYGKYIDEIVMMERGLNRYFYLYDGAGNVNKIADDAGTIRETYKYSAFGKVSIFDSDNNPISDSEVDNPYLFSARRYDRKCKLYFNRARYYSPEMGRFLQKDQPAYEPGDPRLMQISSFTHPLVPIVKSPILAYGWSNYDNILNNLTTISGKLNNARVKYYPLSYTYVNNNPIVYKDPEGRFIFAALVVVGVAYLGYKIYKSVKNFGDKVEKLRKANEEYWKDPTNVDKWRAKERAFVEAGKAGVEMGGTIPGTSLTGPPPTSGVDVVSGLAQGLLTDALNKPGGKPGK